MKRDDSLIPTLEGIVEHDPRFKLEGYLFVLSALHFTQSRLPVRRHVTGGELLEGIRIYALDQFGPLARVVLENWGICETLHMGHMVFKLVEHKVLHRTNQDSLEDFRTAYDFKEAFDEGWKSTLKTSTQDFLPK
ncbi:MAG: hypothetical protein HYY14_04400 [Candidatus Omnitrophica bacterium]|nr:hypothetical protein [Candidatus Omnitrophota bacterium]